MSYPLRPWTAEKWADKQGSKGIVILDADRLCIANMVMQLDDSEMEKTRLIVRAVNSHEELLEALKVALSYLGKGQADGLFDNCSVPGEKLLANIQETIARTESR